jgi:hypothetical protein
MCARVPKQTSTSRSAELIDKEQKNPDRTLFVVPAFLA